MMRSRRSLHGPLASLILIFAMVLVATAAASDEKADSCVDCHETLPDELGAPVEGMKRDVHAEHGLSCVDCHGGDAGDPGMTSMDEELGFRGKPERAEIPNFCGRCHSDPSYMRRFNPTLPTNQRERYQTSVHGKRLADGDDRVATCTSCHGVHGILSGRHIDSPVYPANVPSTCGHCHSNVQYMSPYGLPVQQEKDYRASVHGELLLRKRDLSAPSCSTCHDNHGATPPGATSVADVCGLCHVNNRDFFVASPHKEAFDRLDLPECVVCHGNHQVIRTSDGMLGTDEDSLCHKCHVAGSNGFTAARRMRAAIENLKSAIQTADERLERAAQLGVEVSEAQYEFRAVNAILIKARTAVHKFDSDPVVAAANEGLALCGTTKKIAAEAIEEAKTRRRNLLLPLAVIAVLMVALALKLRQLERG